MKKNYSYQKLINSFYCYRRMWTIRRESHRRPTREITMCSRRLLPYPISQPTHEIRQTPIEATITENGQLPSDRTTLLRQTGREDSNRNADKRHAPLGQLILMAIYELYVTHGLEAVSFRLIFDHRRLSRRLSNVFEPSGEVLS